jgi:hypothetical protein
MQSNPTPTANIASPASGRSWEFNKCIQTQPALEAFNHSPKGQTYRNFEPEPETGEPEMKSGNRKLGGGIGSAVNREVGIRKGAPRREISPRGVSQIGGSLGNHATDKPGELRRAVEPVVTGKRGISVPLGNEVAKNVGAGGPGAGRVLHGQSGSQGVHGPVAGQVRPQGRDILNDFGNDRANVRNRK